MKILNRKLRNILIKKARIAAKIGFVSAVSDSVVQASGLMGAGYGEMVIFQGLNIRSFIFTLNDNINGIYY